MDIIKRAAQELKDRVNKTSQIEKLLQESTSKENWQAHPKTLNTIADYTNSSEEWQIISKYLWEKLYKSDKSWIVTFKTLVLIEYLLKNGSPRCIMEFKDEIYKIRKLQDFQYVEDGEDKGASVRQRSKNIVDLLTDEDKLDHERQTAKELREKMSSVSNNNPYGGMGSNQNGGSYGSASSSSQGSSKYAGFSKEQYKDQKYVGKSSKDAPTFNYKSGDSYDQTEFKGLDKYRKKEEKEEAQPKKNEKTQQASLPKPVEAPKVSIGQIKIQPPSGKPEVSQSVAVAATTKPAAQIVDLFDDEPAKQQPQSQEGEWNWSPAPQQTQSLPAAQAQKQQTQPSFQQFQQAPQAYQQAPQNYQQAPQIYQQAPQVYQQPTQAAQYQVQQQPQYYQPTQQQQQQALKPVQVDLFSNTLPAQQAPSKNSANQQDVDLFSDFQSSTQNQKKENYSKDEFDLINLGDLKKEADKKQKDKEAKTQNANEFGFSTLTTQLDQFSINPTNSNFSAPNNFNSPPQSNYSALNNLNWGQPQYVMPGYQNGMGVPGQQGYPVQGGYVQQGYGQPYPGYNVSQNNNFRM